MDILFSSFKKKDVIDVCSGKKLGKIKDLTFTYPEGKIKSFSVSSGMFSGGDVKLPLEKIERVGEDAILVNLSTKDGVCPTEGPKGKGEGCPPHSRASELSRIDDEDYE